MNIKKVIFFTMLGVVVILLTIYFLFIKNTTKIFNNGNNSSNQEIEKYILDISSYKANITVEIYSNKNTNKYILYQEYISPNTNKQEVIEPTNIKGVKITRDENGITLENSKFSLKELLNKYESLENNCLDLSSFIQDYSKSDKSKIEETNGKVIMSTENSNKYGKYKKLYIDKNSCKPTKMEIKDVNQKTTINILYNEIEINCFNN